MFSLFFSTIVSPLFSFLSHLGEGIKARRGEEESRESSESIGITFFSEEKKGEKGEHH